MASEKRSSQLARWESQFGRDYTDRNAIDWRARLGFFREMLEGLPISRVLEIGCNRGHNLIALAHLLGRDSYMVGVELNAYARELAQVSSPQITVLPGYGHDLPFNDLDFDLVFTVGVLIHIAPKDLSAVLAEIFRVSRKYILAIEYFSVGEEVIPYRGHIDLLWKRDFLKIYQSQFPGLKLIRNGYWGPESGFDRTH